jgi:hypothetical protein
VKSACSRKTEKAATCQNLDTVDLTKYRFAHTRISLVNDRQVHDNRYTARVPGPVLHRARFVCQNSEQPHEISFDIEEPSGIDVRRLLLGRWILGSFPMIDPRQEEVEKPHGLYGEGGVR